MPTSTETNVEREPPSWSRPLKSVRIAITFRSADGYRSNSLFSGKADAEDVHDAVIGAMRELSIMAICGGFQEEAVAVVSVRLEAL